MDEALTISMDAAGRLVIPAAIRRELALVGGAEFVVAVEGGTVHLRPTCTASLASRGRLLVARGELIGAVPDHRELREERAVALGGR